MLATQNNNRKPCPPPLPHLKHFYRLVSLLEYRSPSVPAQARLGQTHPLHQLPCAVKSGKVPCYSAWRTRVENGAQIISRATQCFSKSDITPGSIQTFQCVCLLEAPALSTLMWSVLICLSVCSNKQEDLCGRLSRLAFCSLLTFVLSWFRER